MRLSRRKKPMRSLHDTLEAVQFIVTTLSRLYSNGVGHYDVIKIG